MYGSTVGPNKACVIRVTFTPLTTAGRNARFRLNDDALDSPQRLKLKGNGINSIDVPPFGASGYFTLIFTWVY